jgi:SAM-dependent methyltransferase
VISERPFYGSFAWAYDTLVDRPVAQECAFVAGVFAGHRLAVGARVLDAGCGTGRYVHALHGHGFRVTGLDGSEALLAVARPSGGCFVAGDILAPPVRRAFAGVLCRGVLNDVLADEARRGALRALGAALIDGGVLVLDVRDWDATARRKTSDPVHERTIETAEGRLTFRSETRLDPSSRRLLVAERHGLTSGGVTRTENYEFVMRCWTPPELEAGLREAGFTSVDLLGAYNAGVAAGATDRLVAIASSG